MQHERLRQRARRFKDRALARLSRAREESPPVAPPEAGNSAAAAPPDIAVDIAVDIRGLSKKYAEIYSVSPAIHPEDHIFNFLMGNTVFKRKEDAIAYYFSDGANSAQQLLDIIKLYCADTTAPNVLEFASGYGCVSRHLKNLPVNFTSCDIHAEAIRFLRDEIGADAIQSAAQPEELELPQQFDVVFALSFFSHMPITTWARWLVRLSQATRPGGIVAFTTHGAVSRRHFNDVEIPDLGFWFAASSEQKDLPTEQYGQTLVSATFVRKNVLTIPHVEMAEEREGFWWGHQDLFVLRKTA